MQPSLTSPHPAVQDLLERMRKRPMREDLAPVQRVVERYRPEAGWARRQVVQVVGSNGKGSLVHYLSAWLVAAGHRVLGFTSPHLHHPRERIQVDGRPLSRRRFTHLLTSIPESVRAELTPFELLLVVALLRAREVRPDHLLLEAGMGGRWDATSAVVAPVTVLTGIEREHTDYLGDTRVEILREKTAQIRRGTTLFAPLLGGRCERYLGQRAREKTLDIKRLTLPRGTIDRRLRRMATGVGRSLTGADPPASPLREMESTPPPPGRKQRERWRGREVLYDVAHTPEAVEALFRFLEADGNRTWTMVYGSLEGKRYGRILERVARRLPARRVLVTRPPSPRALAPGAVARRWPESGTTPDTAVLERVPRQLLRRTEPGEGVLVAGSFPLVGWFRSRWGHDA